jgi:pimeloyl-ACP methyl ester carboxylesterase
MFWGWANVWSDEKSRAWNIEEFLPSITSPVLFIQGENDEYGTVDQLDAIQKGVKGTVTSEIIAECGHIPHHEMEDDILNIMAQFIQRL